MVVIGVPIYVSPRLLLIHAYMYISLSLSFPCCRCEKTRISKPLPCSQSLCCVKRADGTNNGPREASVLINAYDLVFCARLDGSYGELQDPSTPCIPFLVVLKGCSTCLQLQGRTSTISGGPPKKESKCRPLCLGVS